ncbi:hypothetical protein FKM82_003684 [Ascaphus truei]
MGGCGGIVVVPLFHEMSPPFLCFLPGRPVTERTILLLRGRHVLCIGVSFAVVRGGGSVIAQSCTYCLVYSPCNALTSTIPIPLESVVLGINVWDCMQ